MKNQPWWEDPTYQQEKAETLKREGRLMPMREPEPQPVSFEELETLKEALRKRDREEEARQQLAKIEHEFKWAVRSALGVVDPARIQELVREVLNEPIERKA